MEITNKIQVVIQTIIAILTYIFGQYYLLFVSLMILQITDLITGILAAHKNKELSSVKGNRGIIKKVGQWIAIAIAFYLSTVFIKFGDLLLDIELDFLMLIGWYTLANYIITEIYSILENLTNLGVALPTVLTAGMKLLNDKKRGD